MPSTTVYAGNNFQSVCNRLNGSTLNGGSNTEDHLPVGYSNTTDSRWRAIIKFPNIAAGIPVGARIVKAEVWIKTTGSTVHVAKGSNARMMISRINQGENPQFSGGSGEGWYTSANPAGFSLGSSPAITYAAEGNPGNGVVKKYDITDYVEFWLPASYLKRDGTPCSNGTNNGIEIKSYDENSGTRTSEFWSTRGGYEPRLVVEYTTEADPDPPTVNDPTPGNKTTAPTSASVTWAAGTGDEGRFYIGTAEDDVSVYDSGWNTAIPGNTKVYDLSGVTWPVGQTLYCEARSRNDLGVVAQSGSTQIYILPVPTVSIAHPGSGGRCHIHNLNELAVWTGSGTEAKPRVEVTYTHPTGVAAQSIEVSVDNGATWHSFPGVASGAKAICDVPQGVFRATDFVIKARATGGGGQQSAEVSLTARVNFSQVVLPFAPASGSSDYVSAHAPLAGGARAQAAYAYRVSGGSWVKTPGELPAGTTSAEMLVRLSTSDVAQPPSVADLTIKYQKTPPPAPDFWTATAADISLDPQVRRFGVHSLKVDPTGAGWVKNTEPVIVSPSTEYTISGYVNTLGATLSAPVAVGYIDQNGTPVVVTGPDAQTTDSTGKGKEDWQRLYATFVTGPDTTELTPGISHGDTAAFRLDSMQVESGPVASSWSPGTLGPAVILDVGGIAIDGQAGGIFRARGSGGEVVTLGANGLELDGEPYITAADVPAPAGPVRRVYTANATWSKPANLSHIEVEVQGGGGGGGGAQSTGNLEASAGAGGAAGGYAKKLLLAAALPSTAAVTVGAAGSAGAGSGGTGGDGGTSSFVAGGTTVTAAGGTGGAYGTGGAGATIHPGGDGGTASGGDINIKGQDGGMGGRFSFSGVTSARPITSNPGGSSPLGQGGVSYANNNGVAGTGYGGGGGGASNNVSQSNHNGGAGRAGVVIVTEYYK